MDWVSVGWRMRWGGVCGFTAGLIFILATWESGPSSAHDLSMSALQGRSQPTIRAFTPEAAQSAAPRLVAAADSASEPSAGGDAAPWAIPARSVDISLAQESEGALVQRLDDGTQVEFTLNPKLQSKALDLLRYYRVEFGAIVAINPQTGELLAMAEHAEHQPGLKRLALQAEGPAASVFKLVTAAALVEDGGLTADSEICTHGGRRGLTLKLLQDNPKRDKKCQTLARALGTSNNVAFGRWADRQLRPDTLGTWSERFLFNQRLPFLYGVGMSRARIPTGSQLGFAKAAAGFQGTTLSPLHGALIAASVANKGLMMTPRLVRSARRQGRELYRAEHAELTQVMEASTAEQLRRMMLETTTEEGSAGRFFHKKRRGKVTPKIPGLAVAGKTGSLSANHTGSTQHYSWFVAFAPAEDPTIAIAALVVNGTVWTVKGAAVAAQLFEYWDSEIRLK